jgi:hypothetical protein
VTGRLSISGTDDSEFDFRTAMNMEGNLERDTSWLKKQRNQQKIKTFEKNCDEISFAKEIYKRKKN